MMLMSVHKPKLCQKRKVRPFSGFWTTGTASARWTSSSAESSGVKVGGVFAAYHGVIVAI